MSSETPGPGEGDLRGEDDRNPKQCPRCRNWCIYDGWAHVHAYGIGIESCSDAAVEQRTLAEQKVARVEARVAEWESELESGAIRDPDSRYCWKLAADEIRAALADPEANR